MASSRRLAGLVTTWIAYWVVAGAIKLGPAIAAFVRATSGSDGHSKISAGYGDGRFTLSVVDRGVTTYDGSVGSLALAAWVAGPPLIAWVLWMILGRRADTPNDRVGV